MIQGKKTGSTQLLFAAGAQAAAQGRARPALLTQLHPFVAAASFVLRLFRNGRTETRPVAGNPPSSTWRGPKQSFTQTLARPYPGLSQTEGTPGKYPRVSRVKRSKGEHSHE